MTRLEFYQKLYRETKPGDFTIDAVGGIVGRNRLWRSRPDIWVQAPTLLSYEDDKIISDAANKPADTPARRAVLAACHLV